jgi:hypothetical protein
MAGRLKSDGVQFGFGPQSEVLACHGGHVLKKMIRGRMATSYFRFLE